MPCKAARLPGQRQPVRPQTDQLSHSRIIRVTAVNNWAAPFGPQPVTMPHKRKVQRTLPHCSSNTRNRRKQLQRGALRKKEGWAKSHQNTQNEMRRLTLLGKPNSSKSLWGSLGPAWTGPSLQKQGLILHPLKSVAKLPAILVVQD